MKRIFLILILGLGFLECAIAQNTLDYTGLTASNPAASSYSLRQLSSNYTGYAIQVRRSSDNTTMDIGFLSGNLDTTALKTFTGSNNAYVSIWYDQSGSGRNASQASTSLQPCIVLSGVIYRQNNLPTVYFNGSNTLSTAAFTNGYPNAFTLAICAGVKTNTTYSTFSGKTNNNLPAPWDMYNGSVLVGNGAGASSFSLITPINSTTGFAQWIFQSDATSGTAYVNGVANGSGATGSCSDASYATPIILGSRTDGVTSLNGWISEFITFPAVLSATDRQTLELNQANYYGITAPVITTQPSAIGQKLCVNGTATDLSVTATGSGTLSYQWYSNTVNSNTGGTLISGANGNSYTPSASSTGTLYYYVVVSVSGGFSVTSNVSGAIAVQGALSATVNSTNPTCIANGSIIMTNPQMPSTNFVSTDFSSLPSGATLSGNTTISGGECILTPAQSNQQGYIFFPVMPAPPDAFIATFDYRVADGNGADGTSFNYGILTGSGSYEYGIVNTGLIVRFIEYGSSRVEVVYNGTSVTSVPFALTNTSYRTCVLSVTSANEISLTIGGIAVFTNVSLPAGYSSADKSSWQFAFASRCGGANNKHSIKNLDISGESLQYSVDGLTWQTANTFSLPAATYTVQAKLGDAVACPIANIATITLTAPVLPVIGVSGITTALDSVSLTASGAVSYVWSGGNSPTTAQNTITQSGNYVVTGTDGSGCSNTANVTVQINLLGLNKYGSVSIDSTVGLSQNGAVGVSAKVDKNGKVRNANGHDGLTPTTAAASAYAIKQAYPGSTDGYYWIKNANINGGTPFKIYADMTTDGGGWTLIMCNASPNPGWSDQQAILRNESSPSISASYSIIAWADYIKHTTSGFQYMIDAQTRGSNGGIWTANDAYSFVSISNGNTNITLNSKFGLWNYSDNDIEARMPWYAPGSQGIITTSADANNAWWGTLIASGGWDPAPWLGSSVQNPGIIWYWVR